MLARNEAIHRIWYFYGEFNQVDEFYVIRVMNKWGCLLACCVLLCIHCNVPLAVYMHGVSYNNSAKNLSIYEFDGFHINIVTSSVVGTATNAERMKQKKDVTKSTAVLKSVFVWELWNCHTPTHSHYQAVLLPLHCKINSMRLCYTLAVCTKICVIFTRQYVI